MLIAITVGAKNRQVENSASRKPRMRQGPMSNDVAMAMYMPL
jgi:hypothetical protein